VTGVMSLESVTLVLTARCNLSCSYCYQRDRKPKRMAWGTLRSSLHWALENAGPDLNVVFLGGEPLLEFPLIRGAVGLVEQRRRADQRIRYSISTNGTLLREDVARLLERYRFDTQLSIDGIAAAQDLRAKGTFGMLDRLLDHLLERHPSLLLEDLTISITLIPPAIPFLAESVRYLIGKGCRQIAIEPPITFHPAWNDGLAAELDRQFSRLSEISLDHYRRTSRVPVLVFRSEPGEVRQGVKHSSMCGVMQGATPAVDVDGQVYGCALLAGSFQKFESPLLKRLHALMKIGVIGDPRFGERFERYLRLSRGEATLNRKESKYSAYGRCGECPWFDDCTVCPVSIAHIPGNTDPDRVPDFVCAFTRTALQYRESFTREMQHLADNDLDSIISQFRELVRDSRA
jgi:sulfatase maturation enzyme AslB (radical SAM superfamily)